MSDEDKIEALQRAVKLYHESCDSKNLDVGKISEAEDIVERLISDLSKRRMAQIVTKGLYRIKINGNELHFIHKPSCIIYMMHLIDRKHRGVNAKPIDVRKYREVFAGYMI